MPSPAVHLSPAEREEVWRLRAEGLGRGDIARRLGHITPRISAEIRQHGGCRPRPRRPRAALRLSVGEREEISRGLAAGASLRRIAGDLHRAASTISREVAHNGGRDAYRAETAEARAALRARRPQPTKLGANPDLVATVIELLARAWSPRQIAARLAREHPGTPEARVSHETIYRSIFIQGRGELRRELGRCLRSGRTERRIAGSRPARTRIPEMVMISERPAEVTDRAVPGHWEGDLLLGGRYSAIATLVERRTRFVLLIALGADRTAPTLRDALAAKITELPAHLRRSLTWDQGSEMAEHVAFSAGTDMAVYFCDPHSPWQRGSNENTNGLLRQWFPKGMDLRQFSQEDLDHYAELLNGRPRETLGWNTPAEEMAALLVR